MKPKQIEMKLIKGTITPFFKRNGFIKCGTKYKKKLEYFIAEIEIQRQRYYKDPEVEKFRINLNIYSAKSYDLFYKSLEFGHYSINIDQGWIIVNKNTDIKNLEQLLLKELNILLKKIEKYNNVDDIIEIEKKKNFDGIKYGFLLKDTNKIKEFEQWVDFKKEQLKKLNQEIMLISNQLEQLEDKQNHFKNKIIYQIETGKLKDEIKVKKMKIEYILTFLNKLEEA